MKCVYELDENDIRQVVANYFDCDLKAVDLIVEPVTVGYGVSEHTEYKPVVTVRVKADDRKR